MQTYNNLVLILLKTDEKSSLTDGF